MGASTVQEAGKIGKCLRLCESLGIDEFSYKGLSRLVDLRPALSSGECLVTRVTEPESFVVVYKEGSFMSPLLEVDDQVLWAYDPRALDYTDEPQIMESSKISILSTRRGE